MSMMTMMMMMTTMNLYQMSRGLSLSRPLFALTTHNLNMIIMMMMIVMIMMIVMTVMIMMITAMQISPLVAPCVPPVHEQEAPVPEE